MTKKCILSFIFVGALVAPATSYSAQHQRYSEWIVPVVATLGTLYYIWSHWDNTRPLFYQSKDRWSNTSRVTKSHKTTIDVTPEGNGDGAAPAQETVTLIQRPVSQQGENNDGYASCGYHSLKNAIGILGNDFDYLTNTQIIADTFGFTSGSWRQMIQRRLADFGVNEHQADWLSVDAFESLIMNILPTRNYSLVDAEGKSCKGYDHDWQRDELARVARIVRERSGNDYQHVFFINTAKISELQGDRYAHWYVLVMEKKADGATTYTVMDSLGCERHQDEIVLTIIKAMHQ